MTEVTEELKERTAKENRTPRDVLRDMMLFYDTQARDIIETIITCLEDTDENGKPLKRGDLLALMYKKHSEAADKAIECASKLAPYEHPKLESVEVKKEITKRFVVRAPIVIPTTDEWLKQIPYQEANFVEVQKELTPDDNGLPPVHDIYIDQDDED